MLRITNSSEKITKTNTLLFLIKNPRKYRRQNMAKILLKSRRGFKKWTKINVQFSKPRVFWIQLVFKTCFRA
jgi:hypothetical protein